MMCLIAGKFFLFKISFLDHFHPPYLQYSTVFFSCTSLQLQLFSPLTSVLNRACAYISSKSMPQMYTEAQPDRVCVCVCVYVFQ